MLPLRRITTRAWLLALPILFAGCGARETAIEPDAVPDAYAVASGALFTPGSTRAWQVTGDGNLWNGAWRLRIDAASGTGRAGPPRRIAAEDRWLPVLHWTRRAGAIRWDFSAAALAPRAPRDSALLVSLEMVARNAGSATAEARADLSLESREPNPAFVAWDGTDEPPRFGNGDSRTVVHAWSDDWRGGDSTRLVERWTLAPGESRRLRLVLPAYPTAERDLHRFAGRSHRACEAIVRRNWIATMRRGARFDLGDPEVENALRAASVVLLSCRERRGDRWVPIGGPFQYRDVWLRDGARAIAALAVAGYGPVARQLADGFLLFQWPNGAFMSQRGQLDGNGQAVWAFEQAWLRPPGSHRELARFAEAALQSAAWVRLQRQLGERMEGNFPHMLPFAEPRDGELTRAQLSGNDAWAYAGLRATARLLAAAGRDEEAREIFAGAATWRADFDSALIRTGEPDLPPSWQKVGRDWGNYAAAWPCEVIDAADPRAARFAERIWRAAGGAGLGFYATPDSLHGYLGADLGVWAMLAGRRAEADSVLAATLHWRTASGSAGELFDRSGHFGANLPPHPTSAAALWLLVRNAVIFDDDDTLRLTLGARERWWRHATIERAPTRWGVLGLEFSGDAGRARWRWTPVPVWTALTLPPGRRLVAAPPAPLRGEAGGTRVWAPPRTGQLEVATEAAR